MVYIWQVYFHLHVSILVQHVTNIGSIYSVRCRCCYSNAWTTHNFLQYLSWKNSSPMSDGSNRYLICWRLESIQSAKKSSFFILALWYVHKKYVDMSIDSNYVSLLNCCCGNVTCVAKSPFTILFIYVYHLLLYSLHGHVDILWTY